MSDTPPGDTSAEIRKDDHDERTGRRLRRWLFTAVVVGAVLWFVGAVVFFIGVANPGSWIVWFQAAQASGQALCVGSAAVLIGWFIVQRWDRTTR